MAAFGTSDSNNKTFASALSLEAIKQKQNKI